MKNSTSIQSVWNTIRQHFRFQITGAHFIDFADIHLEGNERPEDLYKTLMAFEEDVLLKANSLSHHGNLITEDEELTLSLENYVVLTWLQHVHLKLPKLVKQRYGTELRSRTLVSIKPEISQALDSLLDEIRASDDAEVMRTATNTFRRTTLTKRLPRRGIRPPHQLKTCPICKQTRQPDIYHFLSECRHLPEEDRKYIVQARQIADIFDDHLEDIGEMTPCMEESESNNEERTLDRGLEPSAHHIQTCQSPDMDTFHARHPVHITLDSGTTSNMIHQSVTSCLGCHVTPSSQSAHQADGSSGP